MTGSDLNPSRPRPRSAAAAAGIPTHRGFVSHWRVTAGPALSFVAGLCLLSWARADVIPVTTLAPTGPGSLHQAIADADTLPDPPHTIVFDTTGTITLTVELPPLEVDGTEIRGERSSTGEACDTCDPRITISGILTTMVNGLRIEANDCVITGLRIMDFDEAGIRIAPTFKRNQIGQPGIACCERVWLTQNGVGVRISDPETDSNLVRNCRIYENATNGVEVIAGPRFNWIGVDADGERNYIYSNGKNGILFDTWELAEVENDTIAGNYVYANVETGVLFHGQGNPYTVHHCAVISNKIGIDENNVLAGNGMHGVALRGSSPYNVIAENLVVDNQLCGISLFEWSDNDSIASNFVGVNEAGHLMGNGIFGIYIETDNNGVGPDNVVMFNGAGGTEYGGLALMRGAMAAPRANRVRLNVFSANYGCGVILAGTGTTENILVSNYVGTDENDLVLGNTEFGILVEDTATVNTIRDNVIGFNENYGIRLEQSAHNNVVAGNHIGTDRDDQLNMSNHGGILLGSSANTIGGTAPGDGNVICHNELWGIRARSTISQWGNAILGNWIGTNANDAHMGNASGGIWIGDGHVNNDIGDLPSVARAGNVIKHNHGPGVKVGELGAAEIPVQNRILTNQICDNFAEPIVLTNGGNDELPPPDSLTARNFYLFPSGVLLGRVTGRIGFSYPPNVDTRIQVFYDTDDTCGVFYGQTFVTYDDIYWTVEEGPFPSDAVVYATETSRGPDWPAEPTMQTSGISDPQAVVWWLDTGIACNRLPCPWLGTNSAGRSASWIDYNNDGLLDLFIANAGGANFLLEFQGDYVFEAVDIGGLAAPEANTVSAAWADADNDGDLDVYLVNAGTENKLFTWVEGEGFLDSTPAVLADPGPGRTADWADVDLDGDLDLYLANLGAENRLYKNDGELGFTDVTPDNLGQLIETPSAAWGDYNQDGLPDLYIVNGDGPNYLYRNDGGFMFTDVTSGPLADPGAGIVVKWGDFFPTDGGPDLYIVNGDGPNRLLQNLGNGEFVDATTGPEGDAGDGRAVSAEDVDLDGDLDILLINNNGPNALLLNDGMGMFARQEIGPEGPLFSAPMGDIDADGDLDVILINGEIGQDNSLLLNLQADGHHWLQIGLIGTQSNRFGVGARIEVTTQRTGAQTRYVTAGTSSMGQSSVLAEFGVGSATEIDMVRVIWPSGRVSELQDVPVDTSLIVLEPPALGLEPSLDVSATGLLRCTPNPFFGSTRIQFQLERPENVRLRVYDSAGRLIRSLAQEHFAAGVHTVGWDGKNQRNEPVANGIYFLRLETARGQFQRKLTRIE